MEERNVKMVELDVEARSAVLNALYDRSEHLRKKGECHAEQEVLNNLYDLMCGSPVTLLVSMRRPDLFCVAPKNEQ